MAPSQDAHISQLMQVDLAHAAPPLQVLFLHFHKAGGTSTCSTFNATGTFRVRIEYNCICNQNVNALVRNGSGVHLSQEMVRLGYDLCAVEHAGYWPRPSIFGQLRDTFTGLMVTVLREPWARFESNFERDFILKRQSKNLTADFTLENYAECYWLSPSFKRYSVVVPNFYVRTLAGLSTQAAPLVLNQTHLQQAQAVLSAFDYVIILEAEQLGRVISTMANLSNITTTWLSNNRFSSEYIEQNRSKKHIPVAIQDARNASQAFKRQWLAENALDVALYEWAKKRHAEK
mmetsp:Transcript_6425/g.14032  ORF Transcript_6425/g.14032 Transcript_6425/m.14032 type:complete len:289 (+) Transcript_6425:101-967(+)|eukprot:CAMPEP_0183360778 /NCGR_PEP_ID=MMETSP0164_2-20130417/56068_1 /TAXON_ID=221442 /ORGANISM="Coccolithus pelagicus ssp braarudi, Strain PLY182g" /LENGTH=288 /DNA_ID=CAMNT_0025535207 /DNA_START=28 /DNA_END=894 /DNA_ORIENTATION=+